MAAKKKSRKTNELRAAFKEATSRKKNLSPMARDLKEIIQMAKKKKVGIPLTILNQTGTSSIHYDKRITGALPPGYRISAGGNLYKETRKNRSDKSGKRV